MGWFWLSRMPIFARITKAQSGQHSSSVVCRCVHQVLFFPRSQRPGCADILSTAPRRTQVKFGEKSGGGGRSPNDSKKVYSSACCWFDRGKIPLLFFTVPDKQTDPKSSHGLCFPDYLGTITARLATTSQHDVELMICNSPGNQMVILIEVPGGVPASPISLAHLEASSTIHSRVPPVLAI